MGTNRNNDEFLIHMYDQLWNNINRHILTVWQSIASLGAIISIFFLGEKFFLGFDIAISIVLLLAAWLLSHVYDAQAWFDRNIALIQKIEKNLINITDYHGYVGPRPLELIGHLKIQRDIACIFVIVALIYHISGRILPMILSNNTFDTRTLIPYFTLMVCALYVNSMRLEWHKAYKKAIKGL